MLTKAMPSTPAIAPLRRVLIVDDDDLVADTVSAMVRALSLEVLVARTVEEAQSKLTDVQLVLLDVRLPDGSGVALAEHAATVRPAPAIIAISGLASPEEAFRLARAGVHSYLPKPFTLAELSAAIDQSRREPPPIEPFAASLVGRADIRGVQEELRRVMCRQALALSSFNITQAARLLGISRQAVQQMMRELGKDGRGEPSSS
jgi:DNA-binding NtrC family response regulator